MPVHIRILTFSTALLTLASAEAATVTADFNDNSPGALGSFTAGAGQGGGSGFLSGSTWENTGVIDVVSGDLNAPPATGFAFTQGTSIGSHKVQNTSGFVRQTTRELEETLGTGGDIWFSFLLNQPVVESRGGITFNQPASQAEPGNPRVVAVGDRLRLGLGSTLQGNAEGALLTLGADTLIVGQLIIDPAGDETMNVWVNPDVSGGIAGLGAPHTTLMEQAASLDAGVTRIGIQSYDSATSTGGIVDAFRMSDDIDAFERVTADPSGGDDPNLSVSSSNPFAQMTVNADISEVTADIVITNSGATNTLTIEDTTTVAGAAAGNFTILTALPLSILPGQSGTVQVNFTSPGGLGSFEANLELASNDASTSLFSLPMSVSVTPLLGVDASNPFDGLVFPLNPPSAVIDIPLANNGTSTTLTVADTSSISGDTNFTIVTSLPFDIPPGQTANLQVQFDGGGGGSFSGQLDIVSNDPGNSPVTIPLSAEVPVGGVNILTNGNFEADTVSLPGWMITGDGAGGGPAAGIAPGSATSAFVSPGGGIFQSGLVTAADWYADFHFQTSADVARAFNVLVSSSAGQINVRYEGGQWNAYDNTANNDLWGGTLGLGAVTSNATYFMRIVGHDWGTPSASYDLLLSEAGGIAFTRQVTGITRFQNSVPASAPTTIRFSQEFGGGSGFSVDDVRLINGTVPAEFEIVISAFEYDPVLENATVTWTAEAGTDYIIEASTDLVIWSGIGNRLATGESETFTENDVTSPNRFYRVLKD